MSDYPALLHVAHQRLQELSDFPFATPQAETLAPRWLTTPEGLAYLEALQHGADDEAVAIYDQAYGRALNAWVDLLWQAPWQPARRDAL